MRGLARPRRLVALALVVAGTSARASVLDGIPASDLAQPALVACLGVLAVEALVAVVVHARQPVPVAETRGSPV